MALDRNNTRDKREIIMTEIKDKTQGELEKHTSKGTWIGRIVIAVCFVAAIAIYFAVPSVHSWINNVVAMFKAGDFDQMYAFIDKYGNWAMLVSGLLMIFQSIAAPLPAFFITLTNANLFGWWQGCILSWVSSMMGAVLCFFIARILGRDVVERICTKGALVSVEEFFAKYGKRCILICRLLPFVSFDVVSYAAGLTAMDFWGFFVATGVGQMPACIVYSYVGGMLTGGARKLFIGLMCLFALAIGIFVVKQATAASDKKKKEAAEAAGEAYVQEPANHARLVSKLYCASMWAMVLIALVVQFNMTGGFNTGWIFFGLWLVLFGLALAVRKFQCNVKFICINLVVSLVALFFVYGSAISVRPAGYIRMGIGIRTIPLGTINMVMIGFLVIGFLVCVLMWKRHNAKLAAMAEASTEKEA